MHGDAYLAPALERQRQSNHHKQERDRKGQRKASPFPRCLQILNWEGSTQHIPDTRMEIPKHLPQTQPKRPCSASPGHVAFCTDLERARSPLATETSHYTCVKVSPQSPLLSGAGANSEARDGPRPDRGPSGALVCLSFK